MVLFTTDDFQNVVRRRGDLVIRNKLDTYLSLSASLDHLLLCSGILVVLDEFLQGLNELILFG